MLACASHAVKHFKMATSFFHKNGQNFSNKKIFDLGKKPCADQKIFIETNLNTQPSPFFKIKSLSHASFHNFSEELETLSKKNNYIENYLKEKTVFTFYKHSVKDLKGNKIDYKVIFPIFPLVNSYTEEAQKKVMSFSKKFGLYIGNNSILEAQKFAWLPGCVSPFLSKEGLEGSSVYLTTLFDHDDDIDLCDSNRKINLDKLDHINRRIREILNGGQCKMEDIPRVKAMFHIYQTYLEPMINLGIDYSFFTKTLHEYLQSTEVEKRTKEKNIDIDASFYIENRQHTGGGGNAFALTCFLQKIDVVKTFKEYIEVQYMVRLTVDCIGILNDMYSLSKEIKEIQKKLQELGNDIDNELEFKKLITSNLVLLKWKEGLSFEDALEYANGLYLSKMKGFFNLKKEIGDFILVDKNLQKVIFELEGWFFGHPVWAFNSGRYNKNSNLSFESVIQFKERLEEGKVNI